MLTKERYYRCLESFDSDSDSTHRLDRVSYAAQKRLEREAVGLLLSKLFFHTLGGLGHFRDLEI